MKASLLSITGLLISLAMSTPLLNMDIHITDDAHVITQEQHILGATPDKSVGNTWEQKTGGVFLETQNFGASLHENTNWTVRGKLAEEFPLGELGFDSLLFTFNRPEDFAGRFNGTLRDNQIYFKWEKSCATITGNAIDDQLPISGETKIEYH